jgi:hypothetical protein
MMMPRMTETLDYASAASVAVQQLMDATAEDRAKHGQEGCTARTSTAVLAAWTTAMCHERDRNAGDLEIMKALVFACSNLCITGHAQIFGDTMREADIESLVSLIRSRLLAIGENARTTAGVAVVRPRGNA